MPSPPEYVAASGRRFAAFPAAVVVFVLDAEERLLLLSSPRRPGRWEVVNGAMDASETVLDAAFGAALWKESERLIAERDDRAPAACELIDREPA